MHHHGALGEYRVSWKSIALSCTIVLGGFAGCIEAEVPNAPPVADAGEDQEITLADGESEASVTLDGSASSDVDGDVAEYVWLSACPVELDDGGSEPGRADFDPDNVAKPKLTLPVGTHRFTLWVRDNDGARSEGDTVTVKVGEGGSTCGGSCEDRILQDPQITDECRACLCQDPTCAAASTASSCDALCWELVRCTATNCTTDPDQFGCAQANCGDFLGGATGAIAIGPCVTGCAVECGGDAGAAAATATSAPDAGSGDGG